MGLEMIRLEIKSGVQKLTKICNICKCHIQDLHPDDIMIKPPNNDLTIYNSSGSIVTRTEIDEINTCQCENCE
jgi:hypothetical protein